MSTLSRGQQKWQAVAALLLAGKDVHGNPVRVVETNGDNHTFVTDWYADRFGEMFRRTYWCAMTQSYLAVTAGVMDTRDCSAGAWAFTDHNRGLGGVQPDIHTAQVGDSFSIQEGDGHIFALYRQVSGTVWDSVEGNWGDRVCSVRRDLAQTPLHSMSRPAGIVAELAAKPAKPADKPAPAHAGDRLLKVQSPWLQGADVLSVQHFVGVTEPGYGTRTAGAVKDRQHGLGITEDGQVGNETWRAFRAAGMK